MAEQDFENRDETTESSKLPSDAGAVEMSSDADVADDTVGNQAPASAAEVPDVDNADGEEVAPVSDAPKALAAGGDDAAQVADLEESPDPAIVAPDLNHRLGMDWFIIHAYSGFENKVAESLKARSEAYGFADRLGQIMIPTEEVVELRNGKKVTSKRMLYPGYVMVQMAMDDELWHHVKNTPRVTGFVGGGNTPVPLTTAEVDGILNRQASSADRPRPKLNFEKNEAVRIIDGPFTNFQGKVDDVNSERGTLRVLVTIFGRATPVELEFLQVEKSS